MYVGEMTESINIFGLRIELIFSWSLLVHDNQFSPLLLGIYFDNYVKHI